MMMRSRSSVFAIILLSICMLIVPISALTGGPDTFGYRFIDSNSGGPAINWIDISTSGTPILLGQDDAVSANIPLNFHFNYYGVDNTQIAISNNGLAFPGSGSGSGEYVNEPIATSSVHGFIAPYWDDLVTVNTGSGIYYQTLGTAPNRMFVVEWKNNDHFGSTSPNDNGITFEAILYEGSNNIKFQYLTVYFGDSEYPGNDYGGSATVGIKSPGTDGLQYSYNQPIINPNLAILFQFPAGTTPSVRGVPEFPSPFLPAVTIIGFLGAVLFIQRTREH